MCLGVGIRAIIIGRNYLFIRIDFCSITPKQKLYFHHTQQSDIMAETGSKCDY